MSPLELIAHQTADAYRWADQLINSIPQEKWDEIPANVETSVTWQAGHLLMSYYFHSILVIKGHPKDIPPSVPLREYSTLFTSAPPSHSVGKVNAEDLRHQLTLVQNKSLATIRSLSLADTEAPLEPTPFPHPVANTKFEALDWNVKHTMWHCGQLGILKRILDQRWDFGLNR